MQSSDMDKATAYVTAWAETVPPGTETAVARIQCDLVEGPCGCGPDFLSTACKGPFPPVPMEAITQAVDEVPGVEIVWHLASRVVTRDGHLHVEKNRGPGKIMCFRKTS